MKKSQSIVAGMAVLLLLVFGVGLLLVPHWEGNPALQSSAPVLQGKPCAPRAYPPESRQAGEQGIAWVAYATGPDGAVNHAEISRSSGHARLDAASLAHIMTCRFRPDASGTIYYKWFLDEAGQAAEK